MHTAWSSIEKVPFCFSMSSVNLQGHTAKKNRWIWPKLGVSGLYLQFEFTDGYEILHKAWNSKVEMPYCFPRSSIKFQGYTGQNITHLTPIGPFRTIGRSQLLNPSDLPCFSRFGRCIILKFDFLSWVTKVVATTSNCSNSRFVTSVIEFYNMRMNLCSSCSAKLMAAGHRYIRLQLHTGSNCHIGWSDWSDKTASYERWCLGCMPLDALGYQSIVFALWHIVTIHSDLGFDTQIVIYDFENYIVNWEYFWYIRGSPCISKPFRLICWISDDKQ